MAAIIIDLLSRVPDEPLSTDLWTNLCRAAELRGCIPEDLLEEMVSEMAKEAKHNH